MQNTMVGGEGGNGRCGFFFFKKRFRENMKKGKVKKMKLHRARGGVEKRSKCTIYTPVLGSCNLFFDSS